MLDLETKDFLSKEQIRKQAPSVFTNSPADNDANVDFVLPPPP